MNYMSQIHILTNLPILNKSALIRQNDSRETGNILLAKILTKILGKKLQRLIGRKSEKEKGSSIGIIVILVE